MDNLSAEDKKTCFEETANLLVMPDYIIEKDYWVCRTLDILFSGPFANILTFKGGTSLSKAYKVINRFSEDVDLTIDKTALALNPEKSLEEPGLGRAQRTKRTKAFDKSVSAFIENDLMPWLNAAIEKILSEQGENKEFSLRQEPDDPMNIFFDYPKIMDYPDYIKPSVRLELGGRGACSPQSPYHIRSYVAETLPQFADKEPASIQVLAIERTFWEKITILHSVACRPDNKPLRARFSRHYYDTFQLAQDSSLVDRALGDAALLKDVVENKRAYFFESWDWYGTAKRGSFKLAPPAARQHDLADDYQAMSEMIFGDMPDFSEIMDGLQALEAKMNATR